MCLKKECAQTYLDRLGESINEYMARSSANPQTVSAIMSMVEGYELIKSMMGDDEFDEATAKKWLADMHNEDGTIGGHWTIEQTNGVMRPSDVSEMCWNIAMNMMYSDYYNVALRHGVDNVDFYADMAKAFLNDKDATHKGKDKIAHYYEAIVK